jgi:hypothetical protein
MDILDVCNLALDLVGSSNIQTLDSTDKLSKLCKRWGALTYEQYLRAFKPNFATVKAKLQYNVVTQSYQLPSDYVIIVSTPLRDYAIRDTQIYLGTGNSGIDTSDGVEIEYISSEISKLHYASSLFIDALAHSIAAKLAFPLTKEPAIANSLNRDADECWKKYNYSDNIERRPSRVMKGLDSLSTWDRYR